jgi:hypothetical protein
MNVYSCMEVQVTDFRRVLSAVVSAGVGNLSDLEIVKICHDLPRDSFGRSLHIYISLFRYIYVLIHTYIHVYIHAYIHMYINIYKLLRFVMICLGIHLAGPYIYICISLFRYIYMYSYILIYTYIYMHIYICI